MKKLKVLGIFVMLGSCLLLTGCGNKVLSCSISQEQSGLNMKQTVEVTFDGKKVSNLKLIVDSKATSDTIKDEWKLFVNSLDSSFPDTNKTGIKLTKENNAKNYTYQITLDIDVTKAKEKDLAEYDLDSIADASGTYDSVKEQAEKSGFTCK